MSITVAPRQQHDTSGLRAILEGFSVYNSWQQRKANEAELMYKMNEIDAAKDKLGMGPGLLKRAFDYVTQPPDETSVTIPELSGFMPRAQKGIPGGQKGVPQGIIENMPEKEFRELIDTSLSRGGKWKEGMPIKGLSFKGMGQKGFEKYVESKQPKGTISKAQPYKRPNPFDKKYQRKGIDAEAKTANAMYTEFREVIKGKSQGEVNKIASDYYHAQWIKDRRMTERRKDNYRDMYLGSMGKVSPGKGNGYTQYYSVTPGDYGKPMTPKQLADLKKKYPDNWRSVARTRNELKDAKAVMTAADRERLSLEQNSFMLSPAAAKRLKFLNEQHYADTKISEPDNYVNMTQKQTIDLYKKQSGKSVSTNDERPFK